MSAKRTNASRKGRRFNSRKSLAAKSALARAYERPEPVTTVERIAATMRSMAATVRSHVAADAAFIGRKAGAALELVGGAAIAAAFLVYRPIGSAVLNVRDWYRGALVSLAMGTVSA